jgi:outer membrane receptor protein involved in Fe transport
MAQAYYDPESNRTYRGNPLLADSEFINAEIRYENYFASEQRFSVAGFYKKIDRPIETVSFQQGGTVFTTFANAPRADLWGAEAEVQKYLPLNGSGWFADRRVLLSANYTYTDSKLKVKEGDRTRPVNANGGDVPATDIFRDGIPMTGQSDHVANVQIGLQKQEGLSEQTILLSYASKRVAQRGPGDTPDLVEEPGIRLDFVAREEILLVGLPVELKFEARNITGTKFKEYQELGASRIYTNKYDIGQSYSFGMTLKF